MKKLFVSCPGKLRVLLLLIVCFVRGLAAGEDDRASSEPFDYANPPLLTGTIYAIGTTNVLFTFRRSATRSGNTVRVERLFNLPNNQVAAVEHIVYESGRLDSYEMNDLQAGLSGTIKIDADADHPGRQKLIINYHHGAVAKRKSVEDLPKDLLIDDSIYPFILAHWDELMQGAPLKFSMVSLEREKTFVLTLRKTNAVKPNSRPMVWLKMTPANRIVAHFVNPIYFRLEPDGPHRILEYIGRTVPRTKKGGSWNYLDADTVFDWK